MSTSNIGRQSRYFIYKFKPLVTSIDILVLNSLFQDKQVFGVWILHLIYEKIPNCVFHLQYIRPQEHAKLSQVELLVIDEAAAIPLPIVRSMLGPYLVFLSSTVNGYGLYFLLILSIHLNRFTLANFINYVFH